MPNKDGTGPEGKGSKTGRGLGTCDGNAANGNGLNRGKGLGLRRNAKVVDDQKS